MLYAINHDNEEYQKLSGWTKDTNYLIPLPNGTFLKIPKPREGGVVFGALVERMLDKYSGEQPDAFYKFMDTVKASFLPPIRTIAAPINDLRSNKNFIGSPIIPEYMKNMSPGQQYDEKTSSLAKKLGEISPDKISPKKVDYLVKNYLGIIGQLGIPALSEGSTADTVKRIFTADPAYSNDVMQKFYEKKQELDTVRADSKQTGDAVEKNDEKLRKLFGKVSELISDNRTAARDIEKNKLLSDEGRKQRLRDIQIKSLVLADIVNKPLEAQLKVYDDLKRKKFIVEEKPKSVGKLKIEERKKLKRNDAVSNIITR